MDISKKTVNTPQYQSNIPDRTGAQYSVQLLEKARADADTVLKELGSQLGGLSEAEADSRLKQIGSGAHLPGSIDLSFPRAFITTVERSTRLRIRC